MKAWIVEQTGMGDGKSLGPTGFGASAHIVLQTARHLYPDSPVFVFARREATREFALSLGASWAGAAGDTPPELVDCIIDTTPAWEPVVRALECLSPGGRLVINAIRKEAGIRPEVEIVPFGNANQAFPDMKFKGGRGARVLHFQD